MGRKIIIVISLLIVSVLALSRCASPVSTTDPRGPSYAGADACTSCHKDAAAAHMHGSHFKTSSPANRDSLKKWIGNTGTDFYFTDSSYVQLQQKDSLFFQTYFSGKEQLLSPSFDIAFGAAEKAQTFGYWKEGKLYELPLTYFTSLNSWVNSPGFPVSHARYDRVIGSRCFQCHASYVSREFDQSGALKVEEKLDRQSIVFGIDCERCHGPAAEHVEFHRAHPNQKKPMHIALINTMLRQRQLDLCGTCHSGNDQAPQRDLFAFKPGDTLADFYFPDFGTQPDVHGKQLQLLQASRCFQSSEMTCTTCHDAHGKADDQMQVFIKKCMDCHQSSSHALSMQADKAVTMNCIDCHMPMQASKTIYSNDGAGMKYIPYYLRTHKIGVYDSPLFENKLIY